MILYNEISKTQKKNFSVRYAGISYKFRLYIYVTNYNHIALLINMIHDICVSFTSWGQL